jgi:hypothetical protein
MKWALKDMSEHSVSALTIFFILQCGGISVTRVHIFSALEYILWNEKEGFH